MKKSLLKSFLILFSFLFLSCQTEEILVEKKYFGKKSKIETRYLKGNEALRVKNLLNTKLSSESKLKIFAANSNSMRTSEGIIDFNTILQVIDSLGIKNYTFRIINHPDDDEKTFHNLVLTEKDAELEATIMKYEMSDLFAQEFYAGIKNFEAFQGRIAALSLSPADPCEQVTINYPSNGSGNGDGGVSGDGPGDGPIGTPGDSGGNNNGCFTISLSFECSCGNSFNSYAGAFGCANSGTDPNVTYTITIVINYLALSACRTSEDPCNPDGTIGVIEPPISAPEMIEDKIDDSELDPCTKGILDDLKNLQQSDISKIFKKLDNPNMIVKPWYNTKIVIEDPINSINALAQTSWATVPISGPQPGNAGQSRFNYIIKVRPSYLDGTMLSNSSPPNKPTKLSIARTLLHELIHAYFDSLFDDCNSSIPGSCTEIESFEDLWQDYIINKNGGTNPNDAQHLAIAKSFTNVLARALQEYQTGIPVPDNVEPEQDYKDLAWYGLKGNYPNPNPDSLAQIFNLEYPLGSEKRDRFDKINDAENMQRLSNANGSLITPKSTPCE